MRDGVEFLERILMGFARCITQPSASLRPCRTRGVTVRLAHELPVLINIAGFSRLNDELGGFAALFFDRSEQRRAHGKAVSVTNGLIPLKISATIQTLNAA